MSSPQSLEALIKLSGSGTRVKYVFFWGHSYSADMITKSCLSQWYEASFQVDGNSYSTAEHYMMAEKARLFGDLENAEKVMSAENPGKAKSIGSEVRNFDQTHWEEHRIGIVKRANFEKFEQNTNLKEFLINTGNRVLVEASPIDRIWGIGLEENHRDVDIPQNWRGTNLLGLTLMDVTHELHS